MFDSIRIIAGLSVLLLFPGPVPVSATVNADRTFIEVRGLVKDAGSGKPVAFASVSVEGTTIGTVTNTDGEFTLKIPPDINAGRFGVSHVGYRNVSFPLGEYIEGLQELFIEPLTVLLPEVVIKPTDARSIVASAFSRVHDNYPGSPLNLTGFYRETIKQRREFISITEAVVEIYQAPYSDERDEDRFRIVQGRKSGDVRKADTLLVKLQGGPHVMMLLDLVKNQELLVSSETMGFYIFDLLDMVTIDEVPNYVIGFRPRVALNYPLYYGKLYITTEGHAITNAEFSLDLSDREKAGQSFILKKPSRLRFTPTGTSYLVSYKELDGKYHINYIRYELEFFADWKRRLFRTGYTIMSEMAITKRTGENVTRFTYREAFRPDSVLSDQVPVYFEDEFWGEYNYIEPDQSINAAINKLNRVMVR